MEETTFARPAMIPGIAGSATLFLANMAAPGREISWTIVRVIVCAAAIWVAVAAGRAGRGWFSFVFAVAAIIYNPIAIVTGTRDFWGWADFVLIALFVWALASIVIEKPPSVKEVTLSSQSKAASRALSHGLQATADGAIMDRTMTTENVQRDEEVSALGALERDGRAALERGMRYLDYDRDDPVEEEFFIDEAFMIPAEAFRVDDGVETTWPGFVLCAPDQIAFLQPEDLDAKRTDSRSPTVVRSDEFETCIFKLPEDLPDMSTLSSIRAIRSTDGNAYMFLGVKDRGTLSIRIRPSDLIEGSPADTRDHLFNLVVIVSVALESRPRRFFRVETDNEFAREEAEVDMQKAYDPLSDVEAEPRPEVAKRWLRGDVERAGYVWDPEAVQYEEFSTPCSYDRFDPELAAAIREAVAEDYALLREEHEDSAEHYEEYPDDFEEPLETLPALEDFETVVYVAEIRARKQNDQKA